MNRVWEDNEDLEFVECKTCKAKPGMPVLCKSCLKNRHAISQLKRLCDEMADVTDGLSIALKGSELRFNYNQWAWAVCATIGAGIMFVLGYFAERG